MINDRLRGILVTIMFVASVASCGAIGVAEQMAKRQCATIQFLPKENYAADRNGRPVGGGSVAGKVVDHGDGITR